MGIPCKVSFLEINMALPARVGEGGGYASVTCSEFGKYIKTKLRGDSRNFDFFGFCVAVFSSTALNKLGNTTTTE